MRDAIFSRQRYWGEPFPIYYKDNIPSLVKESDLPVTLPEIESYLPTKEGQPPLARAKNWKYKSKYEFEQSTMPGWAGSSWYFIRYLDPENKKEFVNQELLNYWQNVDLYVGVRTRYRTLTLLKILDKICLILSYLLMSHLKN